MKPCQPALNASAGYMIRMAFRMRIVGSSCPDCGRAHGRDGKVYDPTTHNYVCPDCDRELPSVLVR